MLHFFFFFECCSHAILQPSRKVSSILQDSDQVFSRGILRRDLKGGLNARVAGSIGLWRHQNTSELDVVNRRDEFSATNEAETFQVKRKSGKKIKYTSIIINKKKERLRECVRTRQTGRQADRYTDSQTGRRVYKPRNRSRDKEIKINRKERRKKKIHSLAPALHERHRINTHLDRTENARSRKLPSRCGFMRVDNGRVINLTPTPPPQQKAISYYWTSNYHVLKDCWREKRPLCRNLSKGDCYMIMSVFNSDFQSCFDDGEGVPLKYIRLVEVLRIHGNC